MYIYIHMYGSGIVLGIVCFFRFVCFLISCPVRFPCILELETAISTVFCISLEFEPLIFPNICSILVLELFMSHV